MTQQDMRSEVSPSVQQPEVMPKKKKSKIFQWLTLGAASLSIGLGFSPTDKRGEKIETVPDGPPAHTLVLPENPLLTSFPVPEHTTIANEVPQSAPQREAQEKDKRPVESLVHRPIVNPDRPVHSRPVDYFAVPPVGPVETILLSNESSDSFSYTVSEPKDYSPSEREVLTEGEWKKKIDSIIDEIAMPDELKQYYKGTDSFEVIYGSDADKYLDSARRGSQGTTLLTTIDGKPGKYLIVIDSKLIRDEKNSMVLRDTLIEERVQGILYDLYRRHYLADPERFRSMGINSMEELTQEMTEGNLRPYLEWMQHALIQEKMPGWLGNSYNLLWGDDDFSQLHHTQSLNAVSKALIGYLQGKGIRMETPGKAAAFLAGSAGITWIEETSIPESQPIWNWFGMKRGQKLQILPKQQ